MFRNKLISEFPPWYYTGPNGDWIFQVLHAEQGDIGFIHEAMAVYRIHRGGIWYGSRINYGAGLRKAIKTRKLLISHVSPRYKPLFTRHLYKRYYYLAHYLADSGDLRQAKYYARKVLREVGYDIRVSLLEPLKIVTHICVPQAYNLLRGVKRGFTRWTGLRCREVV